MTRTRFFAAALTALLAAAPPAVAETAAQALKSFGLLGTWSPDCAGPIRHIYALHPGKPPTATAIIGGTEQAITELRDASRSGDHIRWIALYRKYLPLDVGAQPWMPVAGERWETVLQKTGDRFRSLQSQRIDGGKILVRDGFNYEAVPSPVGGPILWRKTDEATPLFTRCSTNGPSENASLPSQNREEIPLAAANGGYTVQVMINDSVKIPFFLDSGASDVAIPEDVILTLLRGGSISQSDILGAAHYVLADGSTHAGIRLRIHELRIGSRSINDVVANVSPVRGIPLLGQSFLSRFGSWTVDNNKRILILSIP